jgi:hypothetical protein
VAVPAVPPSLLEPIWAEFTALLSERGEFHPDHPLGCHRRRIPDRVVLEHIVQALVHGSGGTVALSRNVLAKPSKVEALLHGGAKKGPNH